MQQKFPARLLILGVFVHKKRAVYPMNTGHSIKKANRISPVRFSHSVFIRDFPVHDKNTKDGLSCTFFANYHKSCPEQ